MILAMFFTFYTFNISAGTPSASYTESDKQLGSLYLPDVPESVRKTGHYQKTECSFGGYRAKFSCFQMEDFEGQSLPTFYKLDDGSTDTMFGFDSKELLLKVAAKAKTVSYSVHSSFGQFSLLMASFKVGELECTRIVKFKDSGVGGLSLDDTNQINEFLKTKQVDYPRCNYHCKVEVETCVKKLENIVTNELKNIDTSGAAEKMGLKKILNGIGLKKNGPQTRNIGGARSGSKLNLLKKINPRLLNSILKMQTPTKLRRRAPKQVR